MSYDLILFDPAGLDGFPDDASQVVDFINAFVAAEEASRPGPMEPTTPLATFLSQLEDKWGDMHGEKAPWAMWPPATLAEGRYSTLNLDRQADIMTMTMSVGNAAMKAGLVMLDPQGRNALMTTPGGGGLLD